MSTICNMDKGSIRVINSNFTNDGCSIDNTEGFVFISNSIFKNSKSDSIVNLDNMKITGSTFTNNKAMDGYGVINNQGIMTISNSKFTNNRGKFSGAIGNWDLSLTIRNSIFTNNIAKKYGGAISNGVYYSHGTLKVINTKFKNNLVGKTYKAIYSCKESKFTKSKVTITPKDNTKIKK